MTFHEAWYSDDQANKLAELARLVPDGWIVEIGAWEGKSTIALANAVYPRDVLVIDTWQGNIAENIDHPSVIAAKERDVYAQFLANMQEQTKGNFIAIRNSWQDAAIEKDIAFLHIDACHDYASVKDTLDYFVPFMVRGGIMCGDDFQTAPAQRDDLQGGVERAVRGKFGDKLQIHNNLWWVKL